MREATQDLCLHIADVFSILDSDLVIRTRDLRLVIYIRYLSFRAIRRLVYFCFLKVKHLIYLLNNIKQQLKEQPDSAFKGALSGSHTFGESRLHEHGSLAARNGQQKPSLDIF